MRKLLLFLFAVCTVATARAEPAMWVVRDDDTTIYLVGTVHVLKPEMIWNAEKITRALAKSTELWLELIDGDDEAMAAGLMQKHGMDAANPLSKKLNKKQNAKLAKVAIDYGIPIASLRPMKPWMAALLITVLQIQNSGYDPKAGVDEILKAQARQQGAELHGLETLEEQIGFFVALPEKEQVAFLEQTLDFAHEGSALLDRLAKAWSEGDDDTIASVFIEELRKEAPQLYDLLLVQRNIRWAGRIEEMLRSPGVKMVAVGAGHLVGPDSVQVQLEKRGVQVERH